MRLSATRQSKVSALSIMCYCDFWFGQQIAACIPYVCVALWCAEMTIRSWFLKLTEEVAILWLNWHQYYHIRCLFV